MKPASALNSPALGTAGDDLIRPCDQPRPERSPLPPPPREPAIAVALSGGGFRATLSSFGVLRFLADAGMLGQVRYSSSVSGGSVANGGFACRYEQLVKGGFKGEAFDELVLGPFVREISGRSLSRQVVSRVWRTAGSTTRTDLLASVFDKRFFGQRLLEDLTDQCRFVFNAANLSTGVRFGFEREVVGDYVLGRIPTAGTGLRVAEAVAASAAVPGALAPMVTKGIRFPCQDDMVVRLVDGGAYDNSGMEAVDNLDDPDCLLVALNAGGLFVTGSYGRMPLVRDLQLASSLLYRQSTALRRRWMVDRFKAWEAARDAGEKPPPWARRGVLFGLATTVADPDPGWIGQNPTPPKPAEVARVDTSFNRFDRQLCEKLVHAGWWLAGATLTRYHPELFPGDLPRWRNLP